MNFDLSTNTYRPYRKDSNPPTYIQKSSNHPPHVIKQLPKMIGKRISSISTNKEVFDMEAPIYNTALKNSGYTEKIRFEAGQAPHVTRSRTRKREILWFNPPWNSAVSTNVAARFLHLIDIHFSKNPPFHKHFNRHTVKVSYSCMPNMASIISGHNRKVTGTSEQLSEEGCNCRGGNASCILQGRCQTKNMVYKCTVSTQEERKEYIGLTANTFKERYSGHKTSFNNENYAHSTTLSTYIWGLKRSKTPYSISWSIQRLAPPYSKETQVCQLCLTEKTLISLANSASSLNKRNEIVGKCRHRDKFLLKHW